LEWWKEEGKLGGGGGLRRSGEGAGDGMETEGNTSLTGRTLAEGMGEGWGGHLGGVAADNKVGV